MTASAAHAPPWKAIGDRAVQTAVAANVVSGAFSLVVPLFYSVAIDKVLAHKGMQTLHVLLLTLAVVSVADLLLGRAFNRFAASRVAMDQEARYQNVLEKYLSIPLGMVHGSTSPRPGIYISDVDRQVAFPIKEFPAFAADCTLLVLYAFVLAFISLPLAAATGIFVLLHMALLVWNRRSERKLQATRTTAGHQFSAGVADLVPEFETIRANHLARTVARRIRDSAVSVIEASFLRDLRTNDSSDFVNFLNRLNVAVVLWGACVLVIEQQMTVGQMVAFNLIYYRLSTPLGRLVRYGANVAADQASAGRLRKLDELADPAILDDRGGTVDPDGSVKLDGVTFSYRGQDAVALNRVSAAIQANSMVAIQGPSGSGKTTLIRIMARLLPCPGGTVTYGGLPLGSLNEATLRRHLSVVLQTDALLRVSVRDNLRLFSDRVDEAEVMQLTRAIGAHDFIMSHPKGYDAIVGDDRDFSIGQKRRLVIARAILRRPSVLLMDEPTAGLDAVAEEAVGRVLDSVRRTMTVIIATHSPSVIARCDRVITLDHGRVAEPVATVKPVEAVRTVAPVLRVQPANAG